MISLTPPASAFSSPLEFLNHSAMGISDQVVLCCTGCPVYCRVFCIIASHYPLGANSNPYPPGCSNQKCLQSQNVPPSPTLGGIQGAESASVEKHSPRWYCLVVWVVYELERKGSYFWVFVHVTGMDGWSWELVRWEIIFFLVISTPLTLAVRELLWTP